MVNYDMDEIERQKEREKKSRGIRPEDETNIWKENEKHRMEIMKNEMKNKVEVELPHNDILKLALLAHEKDVTLNVFISDVLKQGIKDGEYRYEHDKRPELLNEQNDHF